MAVVRRRAALLPAAEQRREAAEGVPVVEVVVEGRAAVGEGEGAVVPCKGASYMGRPTNERGHNHFFYVFYFHFLFYFKKTFGKC